MSGEPQTLTPAARSGGVHSEARIFAILTQFAVMQVMLSATGIVRNKVIAYRLGPGAFGELVQIGAVTATISTLVCFGMAVGLSRNVARAGDTEERQRQLATANAIVLTLALAACGVGALLLFSGRLLPLAGLADTRVAIVATVIFIAGIPLDALKSNYLAFLQGILDVKGLAIRRSVAVLVATAVAVPLVWVLGFIGAAIQYLLLSGFVAALLGWRCRGLGYVPLRVRFDWQLMLHLASFGIVSLISGFAQSFSDTAVRTSLIHAVGATANGLLQAPYTLAENVRAVVLASIGSISLATIAGQKDPHAISSSVDRLLNVVVPLGTSALGLLGLLGAQALALLYSPSFAPGATLFPYLLGADLLMVFVWVIGAPLLAFGDRFLWLGLELVYAATRWAIAVLFLGRLGAVAVVLGYLAAVALHASLNLAIFRLRYGLRVRSAHLLRLLAGLGLVASLSFIGGRTPGPALLGAAGVAWLAYTVFYAWRTLLRVAAQHVFPG